MAKIYYNLLHAGLWAIEKVPQVWRSEVQALLDSDAEPN